jgi:hypothetical protein
MPKQAPSPPRLRDFHRGDPENNKLFTFSLWSFGLMLQTLTRYIHAATGWGQRIRNMSLAVRILTALYPKPSFSDLPISPL